MALNDIEHLPKVVTNINGINDVLLAIDPEIVQLRTDISNLIKELYAKTTENLIARWENDFSLKYDASLTLAQRRQRILNKLARKRPLTWNNLRLLIKNNLAENVQFYLSNDSANYHFRIIISPEMEEVFDLSKFTVVGSPTITADGIASGLNNNNNIQLNNSIQIGASSNFKIEFQFTVGNTWVENWIFAAATARNFCLWVGNNNLDVYMNNVHIGNLNNGFAQNGSYKGYLKREGRIYTIYCENLKTHTNTTKTATMTEDYSFSGALWIGKNGNSRDWSTDLKQFSITVDGKEVFNGNKRVPKGISEMEKAVRQAKPAYLTFEIVVSEFFRKYCGTFYCNMNPI